MRFQTRNFTKFSKHKYRLLEGGLGSSNAMSNRIYSLKHMTAAKKEKNHTQRYCIKRNTRFSKILETKNETKKTRRFLSWLFQSTRRCQSLGDDWEVRTLFQSHIQAETNDSRKKKRLTALLHQAPLNFRTSKKNGNAEKKMMA